MDCLTAVGVSSIGLLVGVLVGFLVNEPQAFSVRVFLAAVSVVSGSAVLAILSLVAATGGAREYWLYPIFVTGGFFASPLFNWYFDWAYRDNDS